MQRILKGIHKFQDSYFRSRRKLFERLAEGQNPETLFITCADSRVVPPLFTQSEPGTLFTLRSVGNIVPLYGAGAHGGESATIEYGISALNIENIIVCGHSQCGAIKALLNPEDAENLPAVRAWLAHAETTRRIVMENYADLDEQSKLDAAIKENVLVQLEHLRTHPSVAAKLAKGELRMHGWFYRFETGEVFAYDPEEEKFIPLNDTPGKIALSQR